MKIHELFPSYVQVAKLPARASNKLNADILVEAYKIRDTDHEGQKWSAKNYLGGYTTFGSMGELHKFSSTFNELKSELDKLVQPFIKHLEIDAPTRQIRLTNLWLNIMPKGVFHSMHIHPLAVISGTYYVSVPAKSAALKFEDPRLTSFMGSPPRKTKAQSKNQRFISFTPEAGQVILFESWMKHEVPVNQSQQDRVSVSFNYEWVKA